MSTVITVRYTTGSYVARAKGHKGSASSTKSQHMAANGMANKLGLDLTRLQLMGNKDQVQTFQYTEDIP